jgi:hypothetical protein
LKEDEDHFKEVRKPLILVIARVHPGEVGASHALKGMIDYLIGDHAEAVRLRN